jgi:ATP synthase protein I
MVKITPVPYRDAQGEQDWSGEGAESDFTQLTAQQAVDLRERNPLPSPWWVVRWQVGVGVVSTLLAWLVTVQAPVAWSVLYGAVSVVVPAALFARGVSRNQAATSPGTVLTGFFVWEMVKVALTVAMLFAAPRLVVQLNWLALLAGFVVTMKASWLAVWLRLVRKKSVSQ